MILLFFTTVPYIVYFTIILKVSITNISTFERNTPTNVHLHMLPCYVVWHGVGEVCGCVGEYVGGCVSIDVGVWEGVCEYDLGLWEVCEYGRVQGSVAWGWRVTWMCGIVCGRVCEYV